MKNVTFFFFASVDYEQWATAKLEGLRLRLSK